MLTKCPECELPVSDKAINCPHCGYPLKQKSKYQRRSNKKKRLPNGFGQISELKGQNLRKPFRAMVTIGKTDEGKPICKLLQPEAYFETYNDAYQALMEYNKNPFDISKNITLKELYERWAAEYFKDNISGTTRYLKGAWNYCEELENLKVHEIRARHIKQCIEMNSKETTPVVRKNIKTLFKKMMDYAVEYELTDRNYAKDVLLPKSDFKMMDENRISHIPFTDEEIEILWKNALEYPLAEIILFQCYSGWRPTEIENLLVKNINLEEGIMIGGIKTDAGKNRIVPIHSKIKPIVEQWYNTAVAENREYLVNYQSKRGRITKQFTYVRFMVGMEALNKTLGLNPQHRPHDGRMHFITAAKKYNVDEYAIKYIVGHKIKDITEAVYTKRENEWLKSEIEKIM